MLDAEVHDDGGMNEGHEDPRAYAKGSLLYFIAHQNPDIAEQMAPFIRTGTDLSSYITVSIKEKNGADDDRMEWGEIGHDPMMLSYALDVHIDWMKFLPNVLRTSYGTVETCNAFTIKVPPERLEQALYEMEVDQIDWLLAPLLSQESHEPWQESLLSEEAEKKRSAFIRVQQELVRSLVEIQADLADDIGEELITHDDLSKVIAVSISLFNERTHQPICNMSTIDSPESLMCEFGGQVRWSPGTHSDSTMPKGMMFRRWRMADMKTDLLLQATDRLPLESRRILGQKLALAAEVRGLRSIEQAKLTKPGFNQSGIYTRALRARLNEAYRRIAFKDA